MDFFFAPEEAVYEPRISISNLPWLWIGTETTDGIKYTVTDEINSAIDYGDTVNAEFLSNATGLIDVIGWKYLDPTELIEKDFPSTGFLIEDDTVKPRVTEETREVPDIPDASKSE
jgi:hypothetical protein